MCDESRYMKELEKVKSLDELEALERARHRQEYRAQYGDLGLSVLPLLQYGIEQVRRTAQEGNDSELELHIEF